jgi:hypothetical protein
MLNEVPPKIRRWRNFAGRSASIPHPEELIDDPRLDLSRTR